MKQYRGRFSNIKKGEDGIYYLSSKKWSGNNIYEYSEDGTILGAGIFHCSKNSKGYLIKKLTAYKGCSISQEGDTELGITFPKELLNSIARLIGIFPKRNRDKGTYHYSKIHYDKASSDNETKYYFKEGVSIGQG